MGVIFVIINSYICDDYIVVNAKVVIGNAFIQCMFYEERNI